MVNDSDQDTNHMQITLQTNIEYSVEYMIYLGVCVRVCVCEREREVASEIPY